MKPEGMNSEVYERYIADGFTEADIQRIWQDTLYFRSKMAEKREDREITSLTYKNAHRRLDQDVKNWFGNR